MAYMTTLPDPYNKILDSGIQDATGTAGPGFATVKVNSNQPTMSSRTNGARVVSRSLATQYWSVDISYNPLTRDQFEPVNSFLMSKQGALTPFFVSLPQYLTTRDAVFYVYAQTATIATTALVPSGSTRMRINGFVNNASGSPRPGDMFTVVDSFNSNHVKSYMVTRVEKNGVDGIDYDSAFTTLPAVTERVVHFNPPLTYETQAGALLDFIEPKMRVIQSGDVQEYSLGVDGLYNFSLKLEEALP